MSHGILYCAQDDREKHVHYAVSKVCRVPLLGGGSPLFYRMNPFTAHRHNGKLVLEIDERHFLAAATRQVGDNLTIIDSEIFLKFALNNVFTLTHDVDDDTHPSWWLRLTQALAKAAAATGHGVRRGEAVAPTCGCDPEEYDGG
jgi:hypothetical protein